MNWTDEMDEQLKHLYLIEGLGGTEIGKRLGKSRNAVAGRLHRLGVTKNLDKSQGRKRIGHRRFQPTRGGGSKRIQSRYIFGTNPLKGSVRSETPGREPREFPPEHAGVTLMEAEDHHCRNVVRGEGVDIIYCGDPVDPKHTYKFCAECRPSLLGDYARVNPKN